MSSKGRFVLGVLFVCLFLVSCAGNGNLDNSGSSSGGAESGSIEELSSGTTEQTEENSTDDSQVDTDSGTITPVKLEISGTQTKTVYKKDEKFSAEGVEFNLVYSDGTKKVLEKSSIHFTYDTSKITDQKTSVKAFIIIDDKEFSSSSLYIEKVVDYEKEISIKTTTTLTVYLGDPLPSLEVVCKYASGKEAVVTNYTTNYQEIGKETGKKNLTVFYKGLSANTEIEIIDKPSGTEAPAFIQKYVGTFTNTDGCYLKISADGSIEFREAEGGEVKNTTLTEGEGFGPEFIVDAATYIITNYDDGTNMTISKKGGSEIKSLIKQ